MFLWFITMVKQMVGNMDMKIVYSGSETCV